MDLVRIWESVNLTNVSTQDIDPIFTSEIFITFLKENKIKKKRGVTRQSQLIQFVSSKLGIDTRKFTLTVSRYKPIAILARYFSDGILAFLPRTKLLKYLTPLQVKQATSSGPSRGEIIFCQTINKMLVNYPSLKGLCGLVQDNIIQPITLKHDLPSTTGLRLLEENNVEEFRRTDIWDLILPAGRVIEIHESNDVDRSESDAEVRAEGSGGGSDAGAASGDEDDADDAGDPEAENRALYYTSLKPHNLSPTQ